MGKLLMSGNEAIALGAFEAGVKAASGYPGTPSTEIMENLSKYKGVNCEWSVNEKVALEVGLGAAFAGARALVTMKHVGVNVAADPLFTAAYTGIKGGLVVITADEPGMHSSQNEQDNRHYARAAKVPMLEPSDSAEAKEFTKLAFELSEKYDTPVFLRTTTRIAHSMSLVEKGKREERKVEGFTRNIRKYVQMPANARVRHAFVEDRMAELAREADKMKINFVDKPSKKPSAKGIITSGISYTYVREAFPDIPVLKLGLVHPLPAKKIADFCMSYEEIYVVEELDPFLEDQIKAMGFEVYGKDILPITGEYSPSLLASKLGAPEKKKKVSAPAMQLPPRPPSLCPGCPHRIVFGVLSENKITVSGDIGCYTLGAMPPFNSIDTCVDMGASITIAQGFEVATGKRGKTVAVIGDSTFAHSGITGLLNAAYNKRNTVILILDNGTTAMTGMQPNPLSGKTIMGEETVALDYKKLGEAVGMKSENIRIVDAYKKEEVEKALKDAFASQGVQLIVAKGLCQILRRKMKKAAGE